MKSLVFFLTIFLVPFFCLSQLKTVTFSDFEKIQTENKKPIVIHLYTDWCSICKIESFKLNQEKELIKMINENFYFINFEAEKTKDKISFHGREFNYLPNGNSGIHELALALSRNKKQPVYPLWIILDQNQKLLYYHEGEFKPEKMKQKLMEMISFKRISTKQQ
ncbi:redoxin domain-containing protein [Chryseobacterium chendengshani]|uniref:redoxin domain-containing protein n=1 Tax=Chryseobacterium sp. LJ668 TaxID=2864040 RepID=UPI001C689267|nr:redoxin domain-containing protein [Chryseobacterium sp. LJ668]MBW8524083.1 redoxin domain-containing protein [Chryseobacterium sp. LJ668]QYK17019.1 redoxin domain-containing protein [Chryseobacterium sp. LJ668]